MNFAGIDLGTTNSAICLYDGTTLRLCKSPEQHDVTPSALYIDRRGHKYVGWHAYNSAARSPDNSATLFKRHMGTSTPIHMPAVNVTMSPEECSAEILRALFNYLPDDVRDDENVATVITVPAAFNQMQKDATMAAAKAASIGQVALMQEPVAAVMSVMRQRKSDGVFVIYDLGGGTLDVAVAESIAGRVSLLAHGGIEMCGGRDFDRLVFDEVVSPWLQAKFDLPPAFESDKQFKSLARMSVWAVERAKITLSQKDSAEISLSENELTLRDRSGKELYLDVNISRSEFDKLISVKLEDSIQIVRDSLEKAGLGPNDVERIVFVGGPTHYKPLRDKICSALSIAPSVEINPMTAVAEGAAIFAESIDWSSTRRSRKRATGSISTGGGLSLAFNYIARTPDQKARVVLKTDGALGAGAEFQIDSLDTGWSSGRIVLKDGAALELALAKPGDNVFKVFVFDASGRPIRLHEDRIVIARTAASIDAIPASHSIGIEVREKIGGKTVLEYLVSEGDHLPKTGLKIFKAQESLKAGSSGALKFKLWEGGIEDPISDNNLIGVFKISGTDFDQGVIPAGAELHCAYEVLDSGNVLLEVSVPSISGSFTAGRNLYSRQEGQIDYTKAAKLVEDQAEQVRRRLEEISSKIDDTRLDKAREKLESLRAATTIQNDPEAAKEAMDGVREARRLLAIARKENLREIRQLELDKQTQFFDEAIRAHARPSEVSAMENLAKTAQRAIENRSGDFEVLLDELRGRSFSILWRQDWFVIDRFNRLAKESYLFADASEHASHVKDGSEALNRGDLDKLREIVVKLDLSRIGTSRDDDMFADTNILRK